MYKKLYIDIVLVHIGIKRLYTYVLYVVKEHSGNRSISLITRSSETGLYRSRDCVIYNLKLIRIRPRFED